jgi:hypothetical protein
MASKIILKKSNVTSKVPLAADLEYGELALNYTDGKLFYKNNSNVITQLNPAGSGGGGGLTPTIGTAIIDFGTDPGSNEASVVVTGQTAITATSVVTLNVRSDATSLDHTANDHVYFTTFAALTGNTPTVGTGFTITARSHQKLTGKWTINWSWI